MKAPKEQLLDFIDKQLTKHRDRYMSGFKNDYFKWIDIKEEIFRKDEIIEDLNCLIIKYKNILKYIKEHFNINIDESRF